jgi:NADH-quinone oxidoreductase subunit L
MSAWMLLLPVLIPAVGGLAAFVTPKGQHNLLVAVSLAATAATTAVTALLFGREMELAYDWVGFGMAFEMKLYPLSWMILLTSALGLLAVLYSSVFMRERRHTRQFFGFLLLTLGFVNGAMLANNLVLMLFFWEGLLGMLFGLVMTGGSNSAPTATKALIINGVGDLCLIFGVCLTGWLAGSLSLDRIHLPITDFWSTTAFTLMMAGAVAKAGSMPFHSWIPDAALDAPTPFMAFLPAALEKALGIYLLARLNLEVFQVLPGSRVSIAMMTLGCVTIILMVLMALIQKDYKRLLSYHAISQVGYMILGLGTALPIGIVGGLFHMVNNAIYKSCLFYTAGSVERQVGTTDLERLSGLGRNMPVTCACFVVSALAIAGVPPLNGFFSKELVFDAALESNVIFFIIAAVGAFFTAASFLKLGHTVFFDKPVKGLSGVKESPWPMLVPMVILAVTCVVFGVMNPLPLKGMIEPALGGHMEHSFSGLPHNWVLTAISAVILLAAYVHHLYGAKRSGRPLGAADHIHHAPGLRSVYDYAETGAMDPYRLGGSLLDSVSSLLFGIDRAIDWLYVGLAAGLAGLAAGLLDRVHLGRHWLYVLWLLGGGVVVVCIFYWVGG